MISNVTLFAKCLGLNDSGDHGTQRLNPGNGSTELTACLNLTTTDDGAVESIPALSTVLTHSAPVLSLSAGKRFLYQDDTDTKEWDGTNIATRFPFETGPMVHTPIDCRVGLYKSLDAAPAMQMALLGDTSNIPVTSRSMAFAGMPDFNSAFLLNDRLYAVNKADPRFLQYSEPWHYDVWNIGDGFIGHDRPILAGGAIQPVKPLISGVILLMHSDGVTIYTGSNKEDFSKNFYPCSPILGTLYSGFISKVLGSGHIFMATDGIYMVNAEGIIARLTGDRFEHAGDLNATYYGATVEDGKYLTFGNAVAVEYSFKTKAIMLRDPQGAVSVTSWNGTAYLAAGNLIQKHSGTSSLPCSLTLPYSDLGGPGRKSIIDIFFTGTISGETILTANGLDGRSWFVPIPALGKVYNRRIKVPKVILGNHISFSVSSSSGSFRMEKLTATIDRSNRAR